MGAARDGRPAAGRGQTEPENRDGCTHDDDPDGAGRPRLDRSAGLSDPLAAAARQIGEFLAAVEPFFWRKPITYVDVGAHKGDVFRELVRSGLKVGAAHLIEPNPASFAALQQAVQELGIDRAVCHQLALGDRPGRLRLRDADDMTQVIDADGALPPRTFEVEATTLDTLAETVALRRISLLKVDVEGYEAAVLEGARGLLADQAVDMVYIEAGMNPEGTQQTYFRVIEDVLNAHGYRLFRVFEQKNEWPEDSPLLRRVNAAFMSPRFAAANPYGLSANLLRFGRENEKLRQALAERQAAEKARDEQHAAALEAERQRIGELAARLEAAAGAAAAAGRERDAERQRAGEFEASLAALTRENRKLAAARAAGETELGKLRKELARTLASTSWRVTVPLRATGDAVKRARVPRLAAPAALRALGEIESVARARRWLERARAERLVRRSQLFDPAWYLAEYPDVAELGPRSSEAFPEPGPPRGAQSLGRLRHRRLHEALPGRGAGRDEPAGALPAAGPPRGARDPPRRPAAASGRLRPGGRRGLGGGAARASRPWGRTAGLGGAADPRPHPVRARRHRERPGTELRPLGADRGRRRLDRRHRRGGADPLQGPAHPGDRDAGPRGLGGAQRRAGRRLRRARRLSRQRQRLDAGVSGADGGGVRPQRRRLRLRGAEGARGERRGALVPGGALRLRAAEVLQLHRPEHLHAPPGDVREAWRLRCRAAPGGRLGPDPALHPRRSGQLRLFPRRRVRSQRPFRPADRPRALRLQERGAQQALDRLGGGGGEGPRPGAGLGGDVRAGSAGALRGAAGCPLHPSGRMPLRAGAGRQRLRRRLEGDPERLAPPRTGDPPGRGRRERAAGARQQPRPRRRHRRHRGLPRRGYRGLAGMAAPAGAPAAGPRRHGRAAEDPGSPRHHRRRRPGVRRREPVSLPALCRAARRLRADDAAAGARRGQRALRRLPRRRPGAGPRLPPDLSRPSSRTRTSACGSAAAPRSSPTCPTRCVRRHPGARIREARIEADRRQFREIWERVPADAAASYARDGLPAPQSLPDRPAWAEAGLAVWRPAGPAVPRARPGLDAARSPGARWR